MGGRAADWEWVHLLYYVCDMSGRLLMIAVIDMIAVIAVIE